MKITTQLKRVTYLKGIFYYHFEVLKGSYCGEFVLAQKYLTHSKEWSYYAHKTSAETLKLLVAENDLLSIVRESLPKEQFDLRIDKYRDSHLKLVRVA